MPGQRSIGPSAKASLVNRDKDRLRVSVDPRSE
jgi:hypothetical protein